MWKMEPRSTHTRRTVRTSWARRSDSYGPYSSASSAPRMTSGMLTSKASAITGIRRSKPGDSGIRSPRAHAAMSTEHEYCGSNQPSLNLANAATPYSTIMTARRDAASRAVHSRRSSSAAVAEVRPNGNGAVKITPMTTVASRRTWFDCEPCVPSTRSADSASPTTAVLVTATWHTQIAAARGPVINKCGQAAGQKRRASLIHCKNRFWARSSVKTEISSSAVTSLRSFGTAGVGITMSGVCGPGRNS